MPWSTTLLWLLVCGVLLVAVLVVLLIVRRQWIVAQGVCFDLCVNNESGHSAKGWMLGFAVYGSDELRWYRAFSIVPLPKYRFERGTVLINQRRDPEGTEQAALHVGDVIVETENNTTVRQFALAPETLTTLLSWLESSPPGRDVDKVV